MPAASLYRSLFSSGACLRYLTVIGEQLVRVVKQIPVNVNARSYTRSTVTFISN